MTKRKTSSEILLEIHEKLAKVHDKINTINIDVVRVQEQLENVNKTLVRHDDFLNKECPLKHKEITDKVDAIKLNTSNGFVKIDTTDNLKQKLTTALIGFTTALIPIIIFKLTQ